MSGFRVARFLIVLLVAVTATHARAAGGVFVASEVTPSVSGGTGQCDDIQIGTLEVEENEIFGTWFNATGSGVVQVVASGGAVSADLSGSWVEGGQATVQHVDHDLRVAFRVTHQGGECALSMEAKGVFVKAAMEMAAADSGKTEFVVGSYKPQSKDGDSECWAMGLSGIDAETDSITGSWTHPETSGGGYEIRSTEDGLEGKFRGAHIRSSKLKTKQFGRNLSVDFLIRHSEGECHLKFTLKGVLKEAPALAAAAPAPAAAPATTTVRTVGQAAADSAAWEEIKYSNNISDYQRYLAEFPNGLFAALADKQIRDLVSRSVNPDQAASDELAGIEFGTYHALVIGIDNYKHLPKLKTAVKDARAVGAMLEQSYGFKVNLLIDPGRVDIVDAFDELRETLTPDDNLLIYYAGHGWLDEEADEGYWLTRDAKSNRRSHWVSNATITKTLKAVSAKHVMVVADSCYSGTLTRSAAVGFRDQDYLRRMATKRARVAMVSGGLEPVADDSGGGHSPFATAFMAALRKNDGVIDGTRLFSEIRRPVILNARQTPEYSDVRDADHDGGDFLFVRM